MSRLPTITLNIPIYNEERRIGRLLRSIRAQDYPQEKLEILIVDGGSTDCSLEICEQFSARILENPARDQESGKKAGCLEASGELHIYLDADMEWATSDCLTQLVRPWLEQDELAGSFPRYVVDRSDPPLNRYFSRHPLYQDPLMRFLSTQLEDVVIERHDSYALCQFSPGRVPIVGIMLYRTSFVREVVDSWEDDWEWSDVDFALEIALRQSAPVAYVPRAGIHHRSAMTRKAYLGKLRRNVRATYLPNLARRRATYIEWDRSSDVLRVFAWLLYVNLLAGPLAIGIAKSIKWRDTAMLYEAWTATVGTDYVLAQILADAHGRALLRRALRSFVTSTLSRGDAVSTPR